MEIKRIAVFRVDLPFDRGGDRPSGGRAGQAMNSSVIRIETDSDIVGWGEVCPIGPGRVEAFARGARAAIGVLAPALLGKNPSQPERVYACMNAALLGHGYVKHGIDMACWDILGKLVKQPLYTLFGGIQSEFPRTAGRIPYRHGGDMDELIERYRAEGCRQFAVSLGGEPEEDIEFVRKLGEKMLPGESVRLDVDGGWRVDQALRVFRSVRDLDACFEEPCGSYEENRNLRRACSLPIVLDECITDPAAVVRGWHDGVCDAVNLKIARVGGLTQALKLRDLCTALGVPLYVECIGGGGLTQAAIVHLAHATDPRRLLYIRDVGDLASLRTVVSPIPRKDGKMHAHQLPGLGVEPAEVILGAPIAVYD